MHARPSAAVQRHVRPWSTFVLGVVLGACAAPSATTPAGPSPPVAAAIAHDFDPCADPHRAGASQLDQQHHDLDAQALAAMARDVTLKVHCKP